MAQGPGSFPDTRTTLIRRLSDYSDERWRTFFEIYGPLVYRIARRAGLNQNDAEEVLANVMRSFVQAVQRGFEVDHRIGLFRSYLKTMTSHEIAAWRRQQQKHAGITVNHLYVIKHAMMKKLRRIWDQLARELGEV